MLAVFSDIGWLHCSLLAPRSLSSKFHTCSSTPFLSMTSDCAITRASALSAFGVSVGAARADCKIVRPTCSTACVAVADVLGGIMRDGA